MARYPDELLTDDERVVVEFNPHWRALLGPLAVTIVALVGIVLTWTVLRDRLSVGATWAVTAVVVAAWLVLVVPPALRWWFTLYVLTTERIVVRTGMVARTGTEIPLESISNVLFSQSVWERLLGYGDVLLESAGRSGQSRLRDIPHPEAFQAQIYRAREGRSITMSGGDGSPRDAVAQLEALARLHAQGVLTDDEFAAKKARLLDEI
jgi:membrane protein YdbS with pleckstrin-like domain